MEDNMKRLEAVIDKMLDVSTNELLNYRLKSEKDKLPYTDPELIGMRTAFICEALNFLAVLPLNDEGKKLVKIWSDYASNEIEIRKGGEA